jgi:protein-disulfide isomerase
MTSGKQARRQRQAQAVRPPVRSTGGPRKASPKVLGAALGAIALVAAAIALVVALTGGSSSPVTTTTKLPDAGVVNRLFKGIPQSGNVLGASKAPVTMIEYIDLQCSACRTFETEIMPSVIPKYVRTGKVKVEARPIVAIGADSQRGRRAMEAAGRQNRAFDFAQLLYFNQGPENGGWLNDALVQAAASSIPGLDVPALVKAQDSATVLAQLKGIDAQASADKVGGTPTLYVGKTGGAMHEVTPGLVPTVAQLSAALDSALG